MYEQNDAPVFRRILWIVLWAVVAVAIIWLLVWLIFFRHSAPKKAATTHQTTTHQTQPSPKGSAGPTPSGSINAPGTSSTNNAGGSSNNSSSTLTSPDQLANTGAGDVILPVVGATVLGSAAYYIRTRRKLTS